MKTFTLSCLTLGVAQDVRFYPAMEKGKLVEGTARLKLMDLPL